MRLIQVVICLLFLVTISTNCFAWSEKMKCYSGNCDQWEAEYERVGDIVKIHFDNISGKPLYKIKATIQLYDYFGEHLGQYYAKQEGPIHKYFYPVFRIPTKTSRIEYDINCTDEYEGTPPPTTEE